MSEQIGSDLARRRTMGNTTDSRAASVNEASETTSTLDQIRNALLRAAELIEPEGKWCQGIYHGYDGAHCLVGALATPTEGMSHVAYKELRRWVEEAVNCESLTDWNDADGRTQAEVVAALRKAADLAVEAHS
jgi:hypothetical protein